jgi:hypothetical protein
MKNTEQLRARIAQAFGSSSDIPQASSEIAFHMTDWDHNVDDLVRLYENPDAFSDEEIVSIVLQFLAHVPNHVAAAKKLAGVGPIEDVFGVGVLVEDE